MKPRYLILPLILFIAFFSAPHLALAGTCGVTGFCRTDACFSGETIDYSGGAACSGTEICCVPLGGGGGGGGGGGTGGGGGGGSGGGTGSPGIPLVNPLGTGSNLSSFLMSILALVVRIGGIVVILMLVYVGFLFVTARGNDSKISDARKALLYTVIGALILLGAQAIAMGIQATVQALSVP